VLPGATQRRALFFQQITHDICTSSRFLVIVDLEATDFPVALAEPVKRSHQVTDSESLRA
jgi:hypothetical protein